LIDQEQEPHKRHDSLNYTENAGHKIDSVRVDTDLGIEISIEEVL
jgi:hypothetical protein